MIGSTPEEQSFENSVIEFDFYLVEVHKSGNYPESMTQYTRTGLRRKGVIDVEKGQNQDRIYLTSNALKVLKKHGLI